MKIMKHPQPKEINTKDAELCMYLGAVGVVTSLICLIQHLQVITPIVINYYFALAYLLAIVSYILLMVKKPFSTISLIITSTLLFILILFYLLLQCFSLLSSLLMLYTIVVTAVLYINGMPTKLKQHQLYRKQENSFWNDKL